MDDIIVLILTLIFIVAGIFGQKRKRQQALQETESGNQPQKDDFWDLLDGDRKDPEWTEFNPGEREEVKEEVPFKEEKYHFKPENEGAGIYVNNTTGKDRRNTKPAHKKIRKKKFPLKEAVIYSEILQRKYIEES
ncbi:hypothetical protein D1164_18000 [Mariniphaga sediminis]|uniref:Uncharacterized protein n=1 Tax=Mariniphaga sediminis TaxID=1628158 RepID=A0A399CWR2_9BACT|nr:hypothetical protein [Mariniphaga sediminis]RIH63827.1 hypothetical protein D1164_18000 [Mariniphaga sediminis]